MFPVILRLVLLLSVVFAAVPAQASMQIYPTRTEFKAGETTKTITIQNKKNTALTVQISPRLWQQGENGADQYSETDDLLIFPRMATVDPDAKQVIRVRYRGKPADVERAFRLLIEEVPVSESGKMAMRFVVTMSVPVFVLPPETARDIAIEEAALVEGAVHVSLKNAGTVHEQAGKIAYRIIDAAGKVLKEGEGQGWYVLPGHTRAFPVPIPEAPCRKAARIAFSVALSGEDRPPLSGEARVADPAACQAPPKPKTDMQKPTPGD